MNYRKYLYQTMVLCSVWNGLLYSAIVKLPSSVITRFQGLQQARGEKVYTNQFIEQLYNQNFLQTLGTHRICDKYNPIFEEHEKKELQLGWLSDSIDTTQTFFGTWALKQFINCPIAYLPIIQERQDILKILSQNESLVEELREELAAIAESQFALIVHWMTLDPGHKYIQNLFYSFPIPVVRDYLNSKKLALDGIIAADVALKTFDFLGTLCLTGVLTGIGRYASGLSDELDIAAWLKEGLQEPFRTHSPFTDFTAPKPDETGNLKDPFPGSEKLHHRQYTQILDKGTLGDRYYAFARGFSRDTTIPLPFFGTVKYDVGFKFPRPLAAIMAILPAIVYDGFWYLKGKRYYDSLNDLLTNMQTLRAHMFNIVKVLRSMKNVAKLCLENDQLKDSALANVFEVFNDSHHSPRLKELFKLCESQVFDDSDKSFYAAGSMLFAYRLLEETKDELIPLFHALGEIDLYTNLSRLCDKNQNNPWTFVEFVQLDRPVFQVEDFSTPVYRNSVSNSLTLGGDKPTKLLITGPNMAGKSAILRLLIGQGVTLGTVFGIMPAKSAKMSLFSRLITNIDPQENMARGISTFMAESESMDRVKAILAQMKPDEYCMVLIDEPYSGTVNDETARLAGRDFEEVAGNDSVVVVAAAHIMPSISEPYKKYFRHKYVEIEELPSGEFKRKFVLSQKDEPCYWWLYPANEQEKSRRQRYIKWLGDYKKSLPVELSSLVSFLN